jgi:hypothetical protein
MVDTTLLGSLFPSATSKATSSRSRGLIIVMRIGGSAATTFAKSSAVAV